MTWLEFTAEVIGSVSWPLAAVVLGLTFRKQLVSLLAALTHVKMPGVEASFGQRIAVVEESAEQLTGESGAARHVLEQDEALDPSGLIMRSWNGLEQELIRIVSGLLEDTGSSLRVRNVRQAIDLAHDLGLFVDPEPVRTLRDLQRLRNEVAHGVHTPTPGEAFTYRQATHDFLSFLAVRDDWVRSHGE